MDATDRRILAALQADVSGSIAGIADRAGISQTPCWNRIKKLEQAGIIRKRVALVDAAAVGLKLTGYIRLKTAAHNDDWLHKFSVFISSTDEIVECHRLAGDIDYILKIVVPDMSYYDRIYRRLISIVPFSEVSASLSMEEIKFTTELPVRLVK